jgi:DNA-binding NarL/FixJ family response regulator
MTEERAVLLADDHPLVRDSLVRVVSAALPGVNCVEAGTWPECLERLSDAQVAMALVDLNMPGLEGLRGVQAVRNLRPDVAVVAVSGEYHANTVREVLALGAQGFIPKSDPPAVIRQAVALVWAGGTYIPPAALQALAAQTRAQAEPPSGELGLLTPRQVEVLRCLARGLPNKLIAHELDVSEGTAKIHIAAIMRVLRVRNRTEAVVRAKALGFDQP